MLTFSLFSQASDRGVGQEGDSVPWLPRKAGAADQEGENVKGMIFATTTVRIISEVFFRRVKVLQAKHNVK